MKKGFTLIELLVVVLIIGILSSVALPQYTQAVAKSRFSEAMTNLKSLAEAVKLCELENGKVIWGENETCANMNNLSVSLGTITDSSRPYSTSTENFWYYLRGGNLEEDDVIVTAGSQKEDVCICLHEDGHFAASSNSDCGFSEPSYDPAKLLNLTDSDCSCC